MRYVDPVESGWTDGSYYDQLSGPFYLSPAKLESDYAAPRFERELRLFRRFCSNGRVLDVGCSTGGFLFQLRNRFPDTYETLGIDVAGPALDHAESRGTTVVRESFPDTTLPDGTFDAVTFWAVLEHLDAPRVFLDRAARLLAPGGHLFLLVPNWDSLAVRLLGSKYRYVFPQHINYFGHATLAALAERIPGLEPVCRTSTHFNPLVILQDLRGRGDFVADHDRAALLKRTTAYKQNRALAPAKWALGVVESLLASLHLADNTVLVLRRTGQTNAGGSRIEAAE